MKLDLLAFLEDLEKPLPQADHFKAHHLAELFRSKIAKSQAAGRDGVRVGRFQDMLEPEAALIEARFASGTYRFTTFKERLILRGAKRLPRQISIPTVRDRLTLRALCQLLHTHVPATRGHAPHTLVRNVAAAIKDGDQTSRSFIRLDVKDFFPSISHAILSKEMRHHGLEPGVEEICRKAISTPTGGETEPNSKGIPQGLSVSGALSSLYMIRFDESRNKEDFIYFRYVDDILIICETSKAEEVLARVGRALKSRGLIIHKPGTEGKTEIKPVSAGIDFLGYTISPEIVSVRKTSFRRMFSNILKVITDFRYRKADRKKVIDRLVFRLNLKITGCIVDGKRRGWMMFFAHTKDMKQLSHLDDFVKRQLKRVNFPEAEMSRIKRFIKSYHEINFNLAKSSYIPNFDNYDLAQKTSVVAALSTRWSIEEISAWDVDTIDQEFSKLVSREVYDLEQDVGSPS